MPAAARPDASRSSRRAVRIDTYLFFFVSFAIAVVLIHSPFFDLPYFWDEMGQFVPAALDIFHDGAWVPHSTVPNVHPPGVMAYLAGVWKMAGYSIEATRAAMLGLASLAVLCSFLLAIQLCRDLRGAPAFVVVLLLVIDPLFYTQSMMAQLDMPAMLFTVLALLLFLQDRHVGAALACTALVLAKETGALAPLIFAGVLLADPARRRNALLYVGPFVVLAAWLLFLWRTTGNLFGNAGFEHYNIAYAAHPVRIVLCVFRRLYYVFIDQFRLLGTAAILIAWKYRRIYSNRPWKIVWLFTGAHLLLVSVLGGAELERYVLPAMPLVYIAMAAAWTTLLPRWRNLSIGLVCAGLLAGAFLNPPFPFPYENNLAMMDFVELQKSAAQALGQGFAGKRIYTAWPLTQALRDPAFGYVDRAIGAYETSDLRYSTLSHLDPKTVDVLVLYSRTWEPAYGVLRFPGVRRFLARFYEYEPQMTSAQVREHFGFSPVAHWTERGQWIEIYAKR
jgi:4-amino-4-deoxy-L-arabinose transferase-like glycosyltransferase